MKAGKAVEKVLEKSLLNFDELSIENSHWSAPRYVCIHKIHKKQNMS